MPALAYIYLSLCQRTNPLVIPEYIFQHSNVQLADLIIVQSSMTRHPLCG